MEPEKQQISIGANPVTSHLRPVADWDWRDEAIAEFSDVMGLLLRRHFDNPADFVGRVEAFAVAFRAKWGGRGNDG